VKINYHSPKWFYDKQQDIFDCPSRFTLTMAANKVGKTASHVCWINEQAMLGSKGKEFAWVAPFIKTSEIAFNLLKKMIINSELYKALEGSPNQFHFNNSKMRIIYPNKNVLNFFSGENTDAIYGFEIHAAVVDEATRLKEEAWNALLSTMLATKGPIKAISNATVKNNWFYRMWDKAMKEQVDETTAFKLTALDAIRNGIMDQSVFDFAKKNYSQAIFKRDFLAEVPDSEVSVFREDKIYDCIDDDIVKNMGKVRYLGIDLGFTEGQKSDFTVVTGLDKHCKVRFFKRFKASGQELIDKLKAYIGDKIAYIDKTGGGITVYELLKSDCPNLEPYTFSNPSKTLCIENLAHYIHSDKVKYPNHKELVGELLGYEIDFTKTGKTTYNNNHKLSDHDDAVISLALAVLKYKEKMDNGDEPTGNMYTIEIEDSNEDDGWTSLDNLSFDYTPF